MAAVLVAVPACSASGPEVQLRAEMADAGFSDATIDCFVDTFDLSNPSELAGLDEEAAGECVGQVLDELFTEAFEDAFEDLGSGEWDVSDGDAAGFPSRDDMDQLVEQCRAGDNEACDDLWLVSPIDSPEETLAESCGGRSTEPRMGSCAFWLDG